MKKHLILIAFVMAGTVALAQQKGRGHRHDAAVEMKKELSLNDNQLERIKAIDESYRERFHDLRIDSTKSREERMKSMHALRGARKKDIDGVLTDEQRSKWAARETARREEHRAHSERVSADRADKVRKELSLTDEQFNKFQEANKRFREQALKIRQNNDSEDRKEERREEFKKLRGDYDKSIRKILTRDQYTKWTELKKAERKNVGKHPRHDDRS